MKALSRAIDRFCQKHRRFGVPRLMTYIVFISAAVFIFGQLGLFELMLFNPALILRGQVWRLVTWVFLPVSSNIFFVLIALYFYYFVGSSLEREWGTSKFTIYYIFGVVLNIIYGFAMYFAMDTVVYIVPNYLNLSMFFAFAVLFPEHIVRLFFIIPVKVKWLALLNAVFFIYSMVSAFYAGMIFMALLPLVALLNFFIVCGGEALSYIRPHRARFSPQTINYKKAAKKAKRAQSDMGYRHKCSVCGRTDAEFPDLQFRYCSRCEGYHCFCLDHINNHVHFQ